MLYVGGSSSPSIFDSSQHAFSRKTPSPIISLAPQSFPLVQITWVRYRIRHSRPRTVVCQRLEGRMELPGYPSHCPHFLRKVSIILNCLVRFFKRVTCSVLPGIAFSLDLIETTAKYGVAEVLLSSFMAAFMFSIFGAQPLTIAGVTGIACCVPKSWTLHPCDFSHRSYHCIQQDNIWHSRRPKWLSRLLAFHWLGISLGCYHSLDHCSPELYVMSITSRSICLDAVIGCNFLKYVTLFSCDTFGFYVSWVYLQYGVQVTTRQLQSTDPSNTPGALVGIILALLMVVTSFLFQSLSQKTFFHRHVRRFLADYGMPLSLVASSAMAYWGRFDAVDPNTLPIGPAFKPAGGREWLVRFWHLEGKWIGIALPFGVVLWILFFFDHNVSVSNRDSHIANSLPFPI